MKNLFTIICIVFCSIANAQEAANRFFYELTYAPNKDSLQKKIQVMTILDITKNRSVYRDYLTVAQDSILKVQVDAMIKAGTSTDISKSIKPAKFNHIITKSYPTMEICYTEIILQDKISYKETKPFKWNITSEKAKIGEYNAQKAKTTFAGRNWIAWFSTEFPFQDGPYKFSGLPGLIIKVEDDAKNYSWELKGNKRIENFDPESYIEKLMKQFGQGTANLQVNREKFEQIYSDYTKDPFGSIRSQIPEDAKMADGSSVSQMMKDAQERIKKKLTENSNSIELIPTKKK